MSGTVGFLLIEPSERVSVEGHLNEFPRLARVLGVGTLEQLADEASSFCCGLV